MINFLSISHGVKLFEKTGRC